MKITKSNLKGILILFICVIFLSSMSTIAFSKVRVNVDGNVNINFGKNRSSSNNNNNDNSIIIWDDNKYSSVGDITDSQYILKPFILNGKGYAVLRDRGQFYILQAEFYNGDPNRVKNEQIFNTRTYSSNCLAIAGDSNYCLTITKYGDPALWDRNRGQLKYTGRWVKNQYSNNNYYDYYQNSNQSWFEW